MTLSENMSRGKVAMRDQGNQQESGETEEGETRQMAGQDNRREIFRDVEQRSMMRCWHRLC